jgi:hypothetical protein
MTGAELTAASDLRAALIHCPCTCRYEHEDHPRGRCLAQCARCAALWAWALWRAREAVAQAQGQVRS